MVRMEDTTETINSLRTMVEQVVKVRSKIPTTPTQEDEFRSQ